MTGGVFVCGGHLYKDVSSLKLYQRQDKATHIVTSRTVSSKRRKALYSHLFCEMRGDMKSQVAAFRDIHSGNSVVGLLCSAEVCALKQRDLIMAGSEPQLHSLASHCPGLSLSLFLIITFISFTL